MTKSLVAALFTAALLTSGAALADGPAPLITPSNVVSQTMVGVPNGQDYPDFGPAEAPVTSTPMLAQNGQNYPEFGTPSQASSNRAYAQNMQQPAVPAHRGAHHDASA